jgi:hypothetical protein
LRLALVHIFVAIEVMPVGLMNTWRVPESNPHENFFGSSSKMLVTASKSDIASLVVQMIRQYTNSTE